MLHEFRKISFASHIARCARLALALTATAWSALAEAPAAPASPADSLLVETPDGYFSKKAIQEAVYETVPADTRAHLLSSRNAMWVFTTASTLKSGRMYCFSMVGLTEAAPKDRSARIPSTKYFGSYRIEPTYVGADRERDCRSEAARTALRKFSEARLEAQLSDIDRTLGSGGFRPKEPPSATMVHSGYSGVSDAGRQTIANNIPDEFIAAFDYRLLQWLYVAESFTFDNQIVCVGVVGVSARAPNGRNVRFPGSWTSGVWEMTVAESSQPNAEQRCRDEHALDLVKGRLENSWDANGVLSHLELTKENDLPLVTGYRKPKPSTPPAPAATPARAKAQPQPQPIFASTRGGAASCQPPAGQVLRYSDRCYNGNCTRTFENGCSVQFQAPYCYDALKGKWDWKPDGC